MSTVAPLLALDTAFAREVEGMSVPWQAAPIAEPSLLALNEDLAAELGLDADALRTPEGLRTLTGQTVPDGAQPVAQAYAGHQFGGWSPRLGDGRALLLGELTDVHGRTRDLHLKGSGRTPFARGGDGFAAVGPMLRELVVGEAMHALGIPTSRALAVVGTGAQVVRETLLPGAVLVRVASSHLRVGSFQYAAQLPDPAVLKRLLDHAIARHHPQAAEADVPALALLEAVTDAQAALVAQWMQVGFVHGVMNTDNITISGETIDYGPCAFMEAYDPATVFSSIDHGGRYAYGNQPAIMQWDLARLAEALLTEIDADQERAIAAATAVLETFPDRFLARWKRGLHAKLGLPETLAHDEALAEDAFVVMKDQQVDFTSFFRALSSVLRGDADRARALFPIPQPFDAWAARWKAELVGDHAAIADAMDRVNPIYIPRNAQVEDALAFATAGDLGPVHRLVEVVSDPFTERPGLEAYAAPAPREDGPYRTFCGT